MTTEEMLIEFNRNPVGCTAEVRERARIHYGAGYSRQLTEAIRTSGQENIRITAKAAPPTPTGEKRELDPNTTRITTGSNAVTIDLNTGERLK
jgi:hypothetical protein